MAAFLLAWELGGGLGHAARLQPIAAHLALRGHSVELAFRDRAAADQLLPGIPCHVVPKHRTRSGYIVEPSTYADILFNAGCCDQASLEDLVDRWRTLVDSVRPDVAVLDFSPVALLALQGTGVKIALLGTGHSCPPDVSPLPDMCAWRNNYPDRLLWTEHRVLDTLNSQMRRLGQAELTRVAELLLRANLSLLATFTELDHYDNRPSDSNYVGVWTASLGEPPNWPEGNRPRVFAYLRPTPATTAILGECERRQWSTVAYIAGSRPEDLICRGSFSLMHEPIKFKQAVYECDVVVIHAGHGAAAQALLAGKPILALPINGEQRIVSQRVEQLGAGIAAPVGDGGEVIRRLQSLIGTDKYVRMARAFSHRYANYDEVRQIAIVATQIENLAQLTLHQA